MDAGVVVEGAPARISGTGTLADPGSGVEVSFVPADATDSWSGRYFSAVDGSLMFGNTEAFTEFYDLTLPGVLAITSRGAWTVTPRA